MQPVTDAPWKQAPWNPLRRFTARGRAITTQGTNRYTSQPVNAANGLTKEAYDLMQAIRRQFPDSPTKQNYAVDRLTSGGALSDHARGEALDIMIAKYDGQPGISAADKAFGQRVFEWVQAQMVGPVKTGLRGKQYQGDYRISYALFNGFIDYAAEPGHARPLKPSSDQHRDHVHISIVPVDRLGGAHDPPPDRTPPDEPVVHRNLTLGARGEDVKALQAIVGATPDGWFGPQTERKVKAYQSRHGLVVDGKVGPKTWAKIDAGLR